ncbi:MAG: DMT family transporter [Novosphingobium sp.]
MLWPLLAVVLWGGNAVVSKASASVIDPVAITFYRWLAAAMLIAPFAIPPLIRQRATLAASLPRLIVLGLLGCVLFPLLMYLAARDTSAINIGIIQALMPLIAIVLASGITGARIARLAWLGVIVSLCGVAVVVSHGRPAELFAKVPNRGDLVMLAATVCFALYSVLVKRWRSGLPLIAELFVQAAAASLVLLPIYLAGQPGIPRPAALPMIAYAAALASVTAPLLWMKGIVQLGPARAANFFNLLPLVAAALAVSVLGETLDAAVLLGGLLAVAGVVIAERAARGYTNAH